MTVSKVVPRVAGNDSRHHTLSKEAFPQKRSHLLCTLVLLGHSLVSSGK